MNHWRNDREAEAGFTLVEMLVVLAIVAMIMPILIGSLNSYLGLLERAQHRTQIWEQIAAFFSYSTSLLERAVALPSGPLSVQGSSREIVLVAPQDERWSEGGLSAFHIAAIPGKTGLELRHRVCPYMIGSPALNCTSYTRNDVLFTDLSYFEFKYFDRETGNWESSWNDRGSAPALIRIALSHERDETLWTRVVRVYENRGTRCALLQGDQPC